MQRKTIKRAQGRERSARFRQRTRSVALPIETIEQIDRLRGYVGRVTNDALPSRANVIECAVSQLTQSAEEYRESPMPVVPEVIVVRDDWSSESSQPPLPSESAPSRFTGGHLWTNDCSIVVLFDQMDPRKETLRKVGFTRPVRACYHWIKTVLHEQMAESVNTVLGYLDETVGESRFLEFFEANIEVGPAHAGRMQGDITSNMGERP